ITGRPRQDRRPRTAGPTSSSQSVAAASGTGGSRWRTGSNPACTVPPLRDLEIWTKPPAMPVHHSERLLHHEHPLSSALTHCQSALLLKCIGAMEVGEF
ncbi:hypothetical protein BHE74_00023408, partial [Ensete ventricosum]